MTFDTLKAGDHFLQGSKMTMKCSDGKAVIVSGKSAGTYIEVDGESDVDCGPAPPDLDDVNSFLKEFVDDLPKVGGEVLKKILGLEEPKSSCPHCNATLKLPLTKDNTIIGGCYVCPNCLGISIGNSSGRIHSATPDDIFKIKELGLWDSLCEARETFRKLKGEAK